MYSLNIEPEHTRQPAIKRKLSTNHEIEMIPTIIEMCRAEYNMVEPVAIYMGSHTYRVFDIFNPYDYVKVTFIKDAN